jgi:hypothetical protein
MLEVPIVFLLYPFNNEMIFKITIMLVIDHYWILIKLMIILKVTLILCKDTRKTCKITLHA